MSTQSLALIFGCAGLLSLIGVIVWVGWRERRQEDEFTAGAEREP